MKKGVHTQNVMGDYEGGQINYQENRAKDKQYAKKLFENKNQLATGDQLSKNAMLVLN